MRRISPKKTGIERGSREDTSQTTSTKEADERRLRKLKGFLKSVSYNGSEGMQFETLNDLYRDSLLLDRPPCTDLLTLGEFKCNPTPFLVSSCFNKTQVDTNTRGKLRGSRKIMRKTTPNRTRKIQTPNKNANSPLSQIYGKMEGKAKQVKTPTKKQEISKGKVGFDQGRRPTGTLDAAVETAVQAEKSRTSPMKDVQDERKEKKEDELEHEPLKQETEEKMKEQECTKEKDDTDKEKQQTKSEEKKMGYKEDFSNRTNEMKGKAKENKLDGQQSKTRQEQKPCDTTHPSIPSTSRKSESGNKGDREPESKSGKSARNSNTATGKTSFAEAQINTAKSNSVCKTKNQIFEKSTKSDDKSMTKPNSSGNYKEETQHRAKGGKSSNPAVASTSTENRTPNTRLRAKPKMNYDVIKADRQLRLRRERPLTYSHKTSASSDKAGKNKNPGHGYSIRKRNLKKTNTR